jgi:hypothetical protein
LFDRLIDTIDSVWTYGSVAIGQRMLLWLIVDNIDQK